VAAGAILRESARLVRRVIGAVVVRLVAVPAGCAGQAVVVVDVALRALDAGMHAGERKTGGGVVESGAGPVQGRAAMAQGTVLRERRGRVRRIVRAVVIGLVAVPARRTGQAVVVVDVARRTLLAGMQPDQRKPGGGVIERRAVPVRGGVAAGAILREVRRFVRRVIGAVVIGLMAVPASSRRQGVVVVDVALCALQVRMRPS